MNRFQEQYKQKLTTVEDALTCIKSGDTISYSYCAMEPMDVLSKLHTLHGKVEDVTVFTALTIGKYPFMQDPQYRSTFTVDSAFYMAPEREAAKQNADLVSFVPFHLHNFAMRRYGDRPANVAILGVTPMDEHGFFRCSLSALHERELLGCDPAIIVEVNPNYPVVNGDTEIHISQVDKIVESNRPIPRLPKGAVSETDKTIGQYIAELVNDGDTIQLGIGGIPDAVAQALMGKHNLGVHTEMITSGLVDLVEAGVINGRKKSLHQGKIVGAFALGDQRLYDMLNNNPSVEILRASYVNDPYIVAQNDNMVSINTCISIDLTGQVASESIGTLQYSGTGGQFDTAFGAGHAKNGRSIIALHSTAKNGTVSTITPVLAPGSAVTLSRNNVDYVVTEFGVAYLRGRSVRDRVERLIAIAHPDFREELREGAKKYHLI